MQAARKCVRCKKLNEPGQLYCVKCGEFLSKEDKTSRRITIWDINAGEDNKVSAQESAILIKQSDDLPEYVVICPQCNSVIAANNGIIPLACDRCSYFFQAGIDKIVPNQAQKKHTSDFSNNSRGSQIVSTVTNDKATKMMTKKIGPLAAARRDESALRLIVLTKSGMQPEKIKESGDIIGINGTVLKYIKTKQQISIWHSPTGWYARTLSGQPLYNGVPVNSGMQIKLSDGDIMTIEREQVRVEIV